MTVTIVEEKFNVTVTDNVINVVSVGIQGPTGQGIPVGGALGEFLKKTSATDYDTEWAASSTVVNSINDINDVVITAVANDQVLKYNSISSAWENQTDVTGIWGSITGTLSAQTDLQSALNLKSDINHNHDADYAAIMHTHLMVDITDSTWISDYTVTQLDVTTHEAALTITESQISDLGSYSLTSHNHTGVYEPVFSKNTAFNKDFGTLATEVCVGNDARLSDARTPTSHTHVEADITDLGAYLTDITGESIKSLSDVNTAMVPADGQVLTYDTINGWQSQVPSSNKPTYWADNFSGTVPASPGAGSLAIGTGSSANLADSVAIGNNADAAGSNTLAIGGDAITSANFAIALGDNCNVTTANGIAIGNQASSSAPGGAAVAIGALVANTVIESVRMGFTTTNILHLKDLGRLHLEGSQAAFALPKYAAASKPTAVEGCLIWDNTNNVPSVFNGTTWDDLATSITDHTLLSNIGTNTHAQIDAHIADGTLHYTQASISITESQISDLGTYETAFAKNTAFNKDFGTLSTEVCIGNDSRLSDARTPTAHTHVEADITDLQSYLLNITGESIKSLSDVFTTMTPINGQVLTFNTTNGWQSETPTTGVTDHTLLSNIGTNTHAQIDAHIADGTLHYTQASISITESQISDLGTYLTDITSESIKSLSDVFTTMTPINGQVLTFNTTNGWQSETLPVDNDTTDHTLLSNIGTNTHAQIDAHIADGTLHYTQAAISITESQISDLGTYLVNVVEDTTPQLGGNLDLNGKQIPSTLNTQTGTTYTAVLTDADKMITLNNAAAITMTIPANASVAYPTGTKLNFMQLGAGQVTIAITTDTLNVDAALTLKLNAQYAVATALKVTSTTWVLFGNLEAA